MDNLTPPPQLVLHGNVPENFRRFKQSFEIYVVASGIHAKEKHVQAMTLLHVAGQETVELYNSTFVWEEEDDKNDPAKILDQLEKYCNRRKNLTYERYIFNKRNQHIGESIDSYITDLKMKAKSCEFGTLSDSLIRDRIVSGILSDSLRARLLRHVDLKLARAITICRLSDLEMNLDQQTTPYSGYQELPSPICSNRMSPPSSPPIVLSTPNYNECDVFCDNEVILEFQYPSLRGAISGNGRFLDAEGVLQAMLRNQPSAKRVPPGIKENVYFVLDNRDNITRRENGNNAIYVDDCGTWAKTSSSKTHRYVVKGESLCYVDLKDGIYCKDVKRQRIPLEPQPEEKDIIVFKRYYLVLKRDTNFKRRISTVAKSPDGMHEGIKQLSVIEYVGTYPDIVSPHGNAKKSTTAYVRRMPTNVKRKLGEMADD